MENRYALPQQSEPYAKARKELLVAEMALRDQRERVAELRRALPPGPKMPDYVFREGPEDIALNDPTGFFQTRLSELFAPGSYRIQVHHPKLGRVGIETRILEGEDKDVGTIRFE